MIIYASIARQLFPALMEFAEKKGHVNHVTTYEEVVQDSGYLRFSPKSVQFSNRPDLRVRGDLKAGRKIPLLLSVEAPEGVYHS